MDIVEALSALFLSAIGCLALFAGSYKTCSLILTFMPIAVGSLHALLGIWSICEQISERRHDARISRKERDEENMELRERNYE